MNNTSYLQNVHELKENIYKTKFDEIGSLGLLGTYMTVSANLLTYIPELSMDNQYKTIQDIQFHRALSNVDQHYLSLLADLKVNDQSGIVEKSHGTSHIFVTYHTGSYRMFIQHLIRERVPFCLVTEEKFIEDQGTLVQKIFQEMRGDYETELEVLPAENPRLIFELTNRLRNGISVVFYIDGNTGVTEKKLSENANLLEIDFLGYHIFARQGIAFLAYLSKSPLAVAIARRNKNLSNTINIKAVPTEKLIEKKDRKEFINNITKKLYSELERFLKKYPEQWEGWFYVDKFFENKTTESLDDSNNNFSLLEPVNLILDEFIHLFKYDDDNMFLITRRDYKIMKITDSLYEILSLFKEQRLIDPNKKIMLANYEIDKDLIIELLEMKFLRQIP